MTWNRAWPVDVDGQVAQLVDDQQPGAAYRAQLRVEPAPISVRVRGRRVAQAIMGWKRGERRHPGRHRRRPRGPPRGHRRGRGHEGGRGRLGAVRQGHDRTRAESRQIGGR